MHLRLQCEEGRSATKDARSAHSQRNCSEMMAVATVHTAAALMTHRTAVLLVQCGGRRKATERMITTLQRSRHHVLAVRGTLRRLSKQPKPMQIQILQQLLDDQDWQLALPIYKSLIEKDWYKWRPTLHARLVALLAFAEQSLEAEVLVSDVPAHLSIRERLTLQVCLIDSYAKCGLVDKALSTFHEVQSHFHPNVGCLSYRALLRAYISLDFPHQACLVLEEMKTKEFRPCLDDYKAVLAAFGRDGHFADMEKVAYELSESGLKLDQSGFNMILSAYGQARRFDCVSETLKRMNRLSVPCSIHTHNAISISCPTLLPYFESLNELPKNAASLCSSLQLMGVPDGELGAVRELISLGLHPESVKWEESVCELDLHHMFQGTASIALFLWLNQLEAQCMDGLAVPPIVRVVTGWGKHSDIEGRPILKQKVLELLERMQSPFRIDSHNRGVLISRGSALKSWLTTDRGPQQRQAVQ